MCESPHRRVEVGTKQVVMRRRLAVRSSPTRREGWRAPWNRSRPITLSPCFSPSASLRVSYLRSFILADYRASANGGQGQGEFDEQGVGKFTEPSRRAGRAGDERQRSSGDAQASARRFGDRGGSCGRMRGRHGGAARSSERVGLRAASFRGRASSDLRNAFRPAHCLEATIRLAATIKRPAP